MSNNIENLSKQIIDKIISKRSLKTQLNRLSRNNLIKLISYLPNFDKTDFKKIYAPTIRSLIIKYYDDICNPDKSCNDSDKNCHLSSNTCKPSLVA